jgi:anti-sigma B factor antagonist
VHTASIGELGTTIDERKAPEVHAQPFAVTICDHTIHVHGDVDMAVTQQLIDAITSVAGNEEHHAVVVDMASLTFLDSTGIAALIGAQKVIEAMGKMMMINNVPENTHRILTLAGVVDYLNVRSALRGHEHC